MKPRSSPVLTFAGAIMTVLGAAVAILFFLQPWRVCDYEDTSAGCVALPQDIAGMLVGVVVAAIGLAILVTRMISREPGQRP